MRDKWRLAHRLHRPLGWEFLVDAHLRSMTSSQLSDEKERRRAPIREKLADLGYTKTEIQVIEEGGETAMLDIDLRKRFAA